MILTADELLTWAGVTNPTPADQEWAVQAANAVDSAIYDYLDWGVPPSAAFRVDQDQVDVDYLEADPVGPYDDHPEVIVAARLAAGELYRRRDAPFGTTGYVDPTSGQLFRVARDYLDGVKPILWRAKNVAGLVA